MAEVQYDLTAGDILSYWRYLYQYSRPFRAQYWLGFTLAPLGGGWLALKEGAGLAQGAAIFIGVTAAIALVYFLLFRYILSAMVGSLNKMAGGRGMGRHTLTLGPDGIREVGPSAEHAHRWTALQSLQEGPDHFFLSVGFGMAYVIPKRAFHQAGTTIEQFRETVERHRAGGPTTR